MARQHLERDLQQAVVQYLRVACPDVLVSAVPNGGYRRKLEAVVMKRMGVTAGVPDLMLLWKPGKIAFIELKSERLGSRCSPAQLAFHARLLDLNVPFSVCTSIDEVRVSLKAWGVPHRG